MFNDLIDFSFETVAMVIVERCRLDMFPERRDFRCWRVHVDTLAGFKLFGCYCFSKELPTCPVDAVFSTPHTNTLFSVYLNRKNSGNSGCSLFLRLFLNIIIQKLLCVPNILPRTASRTSERTMQVTLKSFYSKTEQFQLCRAFLTFPNHNK